MSKLHRLSINCWHIASSLKLALILVGLLIIISILGATLPQAGQYSLQDIKTWQESHAFLTTLLKPLGMFKAFHSIPFLIVIFLLALNTFTCTIKHFLQRGGLKCFKGQEGLQNSGFILLHLSLILIFAGGFWSSSTRMDGYIVLTEGQVFKEEAGNYIRLSRGPLRTVRHRGFSVRMKKIRDDYERGKFLIKTTANLEFTRDFKKIYPAVIKYNQPFTFRGIDFTLDQTGYSPGLLIWDKRTGRILVRSFLALKTFMQGKNRDYRDFLRLPFLKEKIIVTLYPHYTQQGEKKVKIGEKPVNPVLIIEKTNESGNIVRKAVKLGEKVEFSNFSLQFTGLRNWASFRVADDPGYPLILLAVLIGISALILRYLKEFLTWFKRDPENEN